MGFLVREAVVVPGGASKGSVKGGGSCWSGREFAAAVGGVRVFGQTGRGAKSGGKGVGAPGAGVGRVRFEGVAGAGDGLDAAGRGGVQDPLPVGPVLSQRDQALNALKMSEEVLGPVVGAQVASMVDGLLPQKPASLPLARLNELCGAEKWLVQEGGGR